MSGPFASSRVLIIATNEFVTLVRTKFFLLGLLVMPVLVSGLFFGLNYANRSIDRIDRRVAVVDRTGVLLAPLEAAADVHNREAGEGADRHGPHFLLTAIDPATQPAEDLDAELSRRVRAKEFFAFVEIPADLLGSSASPVTYYTENTGYQALPTWLTTSVNAATETERLTRVGVDRAVVSTLMKPVKVSAYGLVEQGPNGQAVASREVDAVAVTGVPIFFTILMFMGVMSTAQHLIHTIIEEKTSKISEVLLGSVSAFQLLMGKLLGLVTVSLTLACVYLIGAGYAALAGGRPDLIHPALVGWFFVFLLCATCLFGSLFQALSSACSDLKDAQSLLQPAMLIVIGGYVSSILVIRAPESSVAVTLSFIPVTAPFAMLLRIAMPPGPPLWQVLISVVLLAITTVTTVWAAGRIFRVGLLMQGKPPNLPELLRWVRQDRRRA